MGPESLGRWLHRLLKPIFQPLPQRQLRRLDELVSAEGMEHLIQLALRVLLRASDSHPLLPPLSKAAIGVNLIAKVHDDGPAVLVALSNAASHDRPPFMDRRLPAVSHSLAVEQKPKKP